MPVLVSRGAVYGLLVMPLDEPHRPPATSATPRLMVMPSEKPHRPRARPRRCPACGLVTFLEHEAERGPTESVRAPSLYMVLRCLWPTEGVGSSGRQSAARPRV
jgi:hypothetical protein